MSTVIRMHFVVFQGSEYPGYGPGFVPGLGVGAGDMTGVVGEESWIDNKLTFEPIVEPKKVGQVQFVACQEILCRGHKWRTWAALVYGVEGSGLGHLAGFVPYQLQTFGKVWEN